MDYSKLLRLPQYFRNLHRLSEIVTVLVKHGFGDVVNRIRLPRYLKGRFFRRPSESGLEEKKTIDLSVRLRMVFEELGPTFIKFGQIIATRPDVFPDPVIREFRNLHDRVPAFPFEKVKEIVETELGLDLNDVFLSFEESPLAAASLAQVHRARLRSGENVVVKVQRPNLQRIVETDIDIIKGIATLVEEHIPESRSFNLLTLVEEFARALKKECDFNREAQNILKFAENFQDEERLIVPRIHRGLSTKRMIVEEFVDGTRADDIEETGASVADRIEIVKVIERVVLKSVFEFRLFHADPHPGNILITPSGKVAFVDFGKMGRISRARARKILGFLLAITSSDVDGVCRFLQENQASNIVFDDVILRSQIFEMLEYYNSQTLEDLDLSQLIADVFEVIRRHGIKPPPDILSIGRTLTTLQHIGKILDPAYNPTASARPYLQGRHMKELGDLEWHMKRLLDVMDLYRQLLADLPLHLHEILRKLASDDLTIRTTSTEFEAVRDHQNTLANRILMGLIGCTLIVAGITLLLLGSSTMEFSVAYILIAWGAVLDLLVWLAVRRTGGMS